MVLWDTSSRSPWSAGFLNKAVIPCPDLSLTLLTCGFGLSNTWRAQLLSTVQIVLFE